MFKTVKKLHIWIQAVGKAWSAYLGFLGLVATVWFVISALLKWGRPFFPAAWGWPEAIVLGFGAVCFLILVASLALVAWRYFNGHPSGSAAPTDRPEDADTARDVHLDLCHLLYFAVEETTVMLLDDLIRQAPEDNVPRSQDADSRTDKFEGLTKYVGQVVSAFYGTDRGIRLQSALSHVEHNAEHELSLYLKEMPEQNVNVVELRRYFIVESQRNFIVPFLRREREEVLRSIRLDRSKFIERYYRRSPP